MFVYDVNIKENTHLISNTKVPNPLHPKLCLSLPLTSSTNLYVSLCAGDDGTSGSRIQGAASELDDSLGLLNRK